MSDVANTIYRQLGGNKFRVMTGAKNMVSHEFALSMKIGRNKTNANFMVVELNGMTSTMLPLPSSPRWAR